MDKPGVAGPRTRRSWGAATAVEWGRIDVARARQDTELLMLVRRSAIAAARRTVNLSQLLNALAWDANASALICRELHDSWKHLHVLRSYLDVSGYTPAIADVELDHNLRTALEADSRQMKDVAASIRLLLDDATRESAMFAGICARATEAGLARLADRIAGDRQQHALALSRLAATATELPRSRTA